LTAIIFHFITLTQSLTRHTYLNTNSLSLNNQFHQRIWYVEYDSVHAYLVWNQKFRKSEISLDTGSTPIFENC